MTEAIEHLRIIYAVFVVTVLPFFFTACVCNQLINKHYCDVGWQWYRQNVH